MEKPKIFESEYRFCLILWENEPVTTVQLVKLCQDQLGWKRTTTYTVIKRLAERGVLTNDNGTITALISSTVIPANCSLVYTFTTLPRMGPFLVLDSLQLGLTKYPP